MSFEWYSYKIKKIGGKFTNTPYKKCYCKSQREKTHIHTHHFLPQASFFSCTINKQKG